MAKPKVIAFHKGSTSVRIEHLKNRRSLLLTLSQQPGREPEAVEVPLPELIDHLAIEAADICGTWYLLFAARQGQERGGRQDLVGAFLSAAESKAAFVQVRESAAYGTGGWAELVALEPNGRLRQVCWAGDKEARSTAVDETTEGAAQRGSGRWRRRPSGPADDSR